MIGAGNIANVWIRHVWPSFRERAEIVALADTNRAALDKFGDVLALPASIRFTSPAEAFESVDADFCCVLTPPAFHHEAVALACARGIDILSEKPIADSWQKCCDIFRNVKKAGVKMMVVQNYRYTPRILTLKKAVGELGPVNYMVARYASDWRVRDSENYFRQSPYGLLVDCAIHHFDQIRNVTGGECRTISGRAWNPGTKAFDGVTTCLYVMQMTNGSFAQYEGSNIATGKTNTWFSEYYRVECEGGAAVVDNDNVVWIEERSASGTLKLREVPQEKPQWEGHPAILAQFLDWLDGDSAPATVLDDNIKSNAIMFSAIEASEKGIVVDVQQKVREATS
jgi:predicted dehydrogenase